MFLVFDDRRSDSPWIERVWRSRSERHGEFHSVAACHWELVVSRCERTTSVLVRGPETYATVAECPADGEWFAIRFKLGTYMPALDPGRVRDRSDVVLASGRIGTFHLDGSSWELPTFENAEVFVQRLVRRGIIVADADVQATVRGEPPRLHPRTAQRRFLQVTGLSHAAIVQIERARRAAALLTAGTPILDVVAEAGYYDQAHLTRSLGRLAGLTPAQLLRTRPQLSFLYKTNEEGDR